MTVNEYCDVSTSSGKREIVSTKQRPFFTRTIDFQVRQIVTNRS